MLKEYLATDIRLDPHTCIIGEGGSAIVILGFHKELRKKVAIKCFLVSGNRTDAFLRGIEEELTMLDGAEHGHIARVYGWAKWQQRFIGIIMEYYPGGDLLGLLQSRCNLPPVVRLRIASEIADSLSSVHEGNYDRRLIHGDLKPENVLLDEELHCKLADFGSAKLVPLTNAMTTMRLPQQESGGPRQLTPMYAAPELLRDITMEPQKEQDTYSYGILVHTILTLHLPYNTDNIDAIRASQQKPTCKEIQTYKATLAPADQHIIEILVSVMKACWHSNANNRPKMSKVQRELGALLSLQTPNDVLQCFQTLSNQLKPRPVSTDAWVVSLNEFNPLNPPEAVRYSIERATTSIPTASELDIITERFVFCANQVAGFTKNFIQGCQTSGQHLGDIAFSLKCQKQYPAAIFYFHSAALLFSTDPDPGKVMEGVQVCMNHIMMTVSAMMGEKDVRYKSYICEHVLPVMHDIKQIVCSYEGRQNAHNVNLCLASCLDSIGSSEATVGDFTSSERSLREAVSLLESTFKDHAQRIACYASCLNNLGGVCWRTGRINDAVDCFSRALETYRNANDMDCDEREHLIANTRSNLISISSP